MQGRVLRLVWLTVFACAAGSSVAQQSPNRNEPARAFSVSDAIEMRVVDAPYGLSGGEFVWSAKHTVAAIALSRGDINRNGSVFEILTCRNPCLSLDTSATLFTASTGVVTDVLKQLRWLDENTLLFLWDAGDASGDQLFRLDVATGRLTQLTKHETPVLDYDVNADGGRIVFVAEAPRDLKKMRDMVANGFVVENQGLIPLISGNLDGWPWQTGVSYQFFVKVENDFSPKQMGADGSTWARRPSRPILAPNGRYAISTRSVYSPPGSWSAYAKALTAAGESYRAGVLRSAIEDHTPGHILTQYVIIDFDRQTVRPLIDAPLIGGFGSVNYGASGIKEAVPVWSPDGRTVAIGPTFLPLEFADEAGRRGSALALVDVGTGKVTALPVPAKPGVKFRPIGWSGNDEVVVEGSDLVQISFRRSTTGEWTASTASNSLPTGQPTIDLFLQQDLNTSPRIMRRDAQNSVENLLLDLNPQLHALTLGRVELFRWTAPDGRHWTGQLYHPVNESPGHRYPLVIQTHGDPFDVKRFEPNGPTATMFAAQPLASRDIMVLQLGVPDSNRPPEGTAAESDAHVAGYISAAEALDQAGLIDRSKVGIIGWSYTGRTVLYTLTHADSAKKPFAAAIVGQNVDCGYFQRILWAESARNAAGADACVGATPVGPGLKTWLDRAPGFNTDRIHTPIRFEVGDGEWDFASNWEVFQLMRFQRKPVEMFAIPNFKNGVHLLQNPAQRLASQGGTVDWFDFWLNGHEDPAPAKAEQYARWHKLRELSN